MSTCFVTTSGSSLSEVAHSALRCCSARCSSNPSPLTRHLGFFFLNLPFSVSHCVPFLFFIPRQDALVLTKVSGKKGGVGVEKKGKNTLATNDARAMRMRGDPHILMQHSARSTCASLLNAGNNFTPAQSVFAIKEKKSIHYFLFIYIYFCHFDSLLPLLHETYSQSAFCDVG